MKEEQFLIIVTNSDGAPPSNTLISTPLAPIYGSTNVLIASDMHAPRIAVVPITTGSHIAFSNTIIPASVLNLRGGEYASSTVEGAVAESPGNWTVISDTDTGLYIRTDLAGLAPVFHRRQGDVLCISNNPDLLRQGGNVSPALVSTGLLYPAAPAGLDQRDLEDDIGALPPGTTSSVDTRTLQISTVAEATMDTATLDIEAGAEHLRQALLNSVTATPVGYEVGADLSGGFDSTSLCFLLDSQQLNFKSFSTSGRHHTSDDLHWSDWAQTQLKHSHRTVWAADEVPLPFEIGPYCSSAPYVGLANTARTAWTARAVAEAGVEVHFGGHGGDELFSLTEHYLYQRLRRSPAKCIANALGFRSLHRWSLAETCGMLLPLGSAEANRRRFIRQLNSEPDANNLGVDRWNHGISFFPTWLNQRSRDIATETIQKQVFGTEPTTDWARIARGIISASGNSTRHIHQIYRNEGVHLRTPFLDESVIRAALRTKPEQAIQPHPPKLLLSRSLEGLAPSQLYARRTKDSGSADVFSGWRKERANIVAMATNGPLTDCNYIDPSMAKSAAMNQLGSQVHPIALFRTIAMNRALQRLEELGTHVQPI